MKSDAEIHLLKVLKERGIPLIEDDVSWAFESAQTRDKVIAWVDEYLDRSTLLTAEELDLFRKIPKKSVSINSASLSKLPALSDDEISEALKSLQSSTTAIEEQCRVLESQRDALNSIRAESRASATSARSRADRSRRRGDEKSQLNIDVEDLVSTASSRLSTAQRDVENVVHPLLSSATEQLNSDDRTMARLSKVIQILETNSNERQDLAQIDRWCQSLARLREAEVKARIDVTFTSNAAKPKRTESLNVSQEEALSEQRALQDELKTLRSEVASVAEMVVNYEIQEPIVKHSQSLVTSKIDTQQSWLQYISSSLEFMCNRLEQSSLHMNHLMAYNKAVAHFEKTLALEKPVPEQPITKSHRRSSSFPLTPNFLPKQAAQVPNAIARMLQNLDISLTVGHGVDVRTAMSQATSERQDRLEDYHESVQSNLAQIIGETMDSANGEMTRLLASAYSNSRYKTVHLENPVQNARLQKLERGMGEIGQEMTGVETMLSSLDEDHAEHLISLIHKHLGLDSDP
ncbi:hypothetical protein EJ05DRAFT_472054 [Pseudovirgaria hyperparasitica]|uniref:HAUS augmin-like complex subunit 3 N-terminal domain-containing protein n=1 Tax=Pseudovirgaria hyperparasitica TaxID=470096 RepID=A0A6A6WLN7_9PEZI|nr:uncharacterized protein EJ05DRAFT_472054 [Pseudovirgaria hyperparasitica]KAF2763117.1 hypothetical protein EJ05DRAFT_472054 [Pseudovirgaria hyperparasitica]